MDDARIAVNEAAFRRVNEAIRAGMPPVEDHVNLICECGRLGCSEHIAIEPRAYEEVRADRRRFIVVPGHELPEAERVVESQERYRVVEKFGEAGDIAERLSRRPLPDLGLPPDDEG